VAKVWRAYNVYVRTVTPNATEPGVYYVEHSAMVYMIDKSFRVRAAFMGAPPFWNYEDVVNNVEALE
jgi:cytochrome oxidase Cu insertion factor (SCO1/SenC/PrrC family)